MSRNLRFTTQVLILLLLMTVVVAGCGRSIDRRYGRSNDASINGVSAFANFLRERGHAVTRQTRLSSRLDDCNTIFWAPDNRNMPPEDIVGWLENWLAEDSKRTLIYVGHGYRSNVEFHRDILKNAPIEEREAWKRELAEALIESDDDESAWFNPTFSGKPFWFETNKDPKIESRKLAGPWAKGVDENKAQIDIEHIIQPADFHLNVPETYVDSEEDFDPYDYYEPQPTFRDSKLTTTNLLTVDEVPFAFQIAPEAQPNQRLILISNASFLLNLSLIDTENRKLAQHVADACHGDVVILESAYRWPAIGGRGNNPQLAWSWIAQPPMSYIVPHFLFWGVLYCFVYFPNFGRSKRIQFHPPKSFSKHVHAVGEILRRSKEHSWARRRIDEYLKRNSHSKN